MQELFQMFNWELQCEEKGRKGKGRRKLCDNNLPWSTQPCMNISTHFSMYNLYFSYKPNI